MRKRGGSIHHAPDLFSSVMFPEYNTLCNLPVSRLTVPDEIIRHKALERVPTKGRPSKIKMVMCEPYKYLTIPILHSGRLAKDNYNRRTVEREHCRYTAVLHEQ